MEHGPYNDIKLGVPVEGVQEKWLTILLGEGVGTCGGSRDCRRQQTNERVKGRMINEEKNPGPGV